ncbi:hypothetical protein [Methylophilus sp. OH31]|uniref:hypothetical protein n=1 Tax=Methylophilus sp. OH31 TaxID=1387312 RepID=UPI001F597C45|nr:hypothetical protein [Methylophilus sp. OH31]
MTVIWLLRRCAWYLGWVPMVSSVALLVMWLVLSQQQSGQLAQLGALEQEIRQLAVRPVHQDRVTPAKPEKTLAIDVKTAPDEPVELAALWRQLPAFADLSPRMMHIASLAQKRQIALNVGDYQWQAHQATSATQASSATQDIQQFDMRFTIQADYATCRQFMMDVLKQYPSMALTGLELRKNETVQPVVDATLTFSVFIRGGRAHGA